MQRMIFMGCESLALLLSRVRLRLRPRIVLNAMRRRNRRGYMTRG